MTQAYWTIFNKFCDMRGRPISIAINAERQCSLSLENDDPKSPHLLSSRDISPSSILIHDGEISFFYRTPLTNKWPGLEVKPVQWNATSNSSPISSDLIIIVT